MFSPSPQKIKKTTKTQGFKSLSVFYSLTIGYQKKIGRSSTTAHEMQQLHLSVTPPLAEMQNLKLSVLIHADTSISNTSISYKAKQKRGNGTFVTHASFHSFSVACKSRVTTEIPLTLAGIRTALTHISTHNRQATSPAKHAAMLTTL